MKKSIFTFLAIISVFLQTGCFALENETSFLLNKTQKETREAFEAQQQLLKALQNAGIQTSDLEKLGNQGQEKLEEVQAVLLNLLKSISETPVDTVHDRAENAQKAIETFLTYLETQKTGLKEEEIFEEKLEDIIEDVEDDVEEEVEEIEDDVEELEDELLEEVPEEEITTEEDVEENILDDIEEVDDEEKIDETEGGDDTSEEIFEKEEEGIEKIDDEEEIEEIEEEDKGDEGTEEETIDMDIDIDEEEYEDEE